MALSRSLRDSVGAGGFALVASLFAGVVLVVADLASTGDENYSGVLAVVPLIACAGLSRRWVTGIAVFTTSVALGLLVVDDVSRNHGAIRIVVVMGCGGLAIAMATRREIADAQLVELGELGGVARGMVLHPIPEDTGCYELSARYEGPPNHHGVGGDLCDLARTATGVRLIVGDAMGNGISGLRIAAAVATRFHDLAAVVDAGELVEALNDTVTTMADDCDEGSFVTAIIVDLEEDGTVTILNCGHPDALLVGASQHFVVPPRRTPPLGLGAHPVPFSTSLAPGDRLVVFTDGVCEARDRTARFLDVAAIPFPPGSAAQTVDTLFAAVQAHTGTAQQQDDVLIVAVRYHPPHGTDGPQLIRSQTSN